MADGDEDETPSGFAYIPNIPDVDSCLPLILANTTHEVLINSTFDSIAFAPWVSTNCSSRLLNTAWNDGSNLKAFLFYTPNTTSVPDEKDPLWDGVDFSNYTFPIYAVSGSAATPLMFMVSSYAGNVSEENNDDFNGLNQTVQNYARAYIEVGSGTSIGLPGLWIFLVTVVTVAIAVIIAVSITMHYIQIHRRQELRRMLNAGEIDVERLVGTWRPTIPTDMLKTLPLKHYNSFRTRTETSEHGYLSGEDAPGNRTSATPATPLLPDPPPALLPPDPPLPPDPILSAPLLTIHDTTSGFDQTACAICLDQFATMVQVRVLPCEHIFHPDCIDRHLTMQSSKCPLCLQSTMPKIPVPTKITNRMIRRWRDQERERREHTRALQWRPENNILWWWPRRPTITFMWPLRRAEMGHGWEQGRREPEEEMRQVQDRTHEASLQPTRQQRAEAGGTGDREDDDGRERETGKLRKIVNRIFP